MMFSWFPVVTMIFILKIFYPILYKFILILCLSALKIITARTYQNFIEIGVFVLKWNMLI